MIGSFTPSQIAVGIPFVLTLFGVAMFAIVGALGGIADNVAGVAARIGVFCVSVGVATFILEWVAIALWNYMQ